MPRASNGPRLHGGCPGGGGSSVSGGVGGEGDKGDGSGRGRGGALGRRGGKKGGGRGGHRGRCVRTKRFLASPPPSTPVAAPDSHFPGLPSSTLHNLPLRPFLLLVFLRGQESGGKIGGGEGRAGP
jgi:hypothetical protein